MTVGENIKRIRKENGLTQKELGEKCGMKESNVRKYELDRVHPKIETLSRIANGLGVSVFNLLPSDGIPEDQFNEYFGKLTDKSEDIIPKTNIFWDYLNSLGYEITKSPNNKWIVHVTESDSELYLSNSEFKKLEETTKENIDLRMNNYLHDGKHTK